MQNQNHNEVITVVRDPAHTLGKELSRNSDDSINNKSAVNGVSGIATQHLVPDDQAVVATLAETEDLFKGLMRSPDKTYFIGSLDKRTRQFHNVAVTSISQAVQYAFAYSAMGLDTYVACAEFSSAKNRTAINARGAWAFWIDIDVGQGKAYANIDEANSAVIEFCDKTGLPYPTIVVNSGTGLHVYWVFDAFQIRNEWIAYATKLKALMKAVGLHADPSRTADIASVLRVPGTLNYKYSPPRPVTILSAKEERIELTVMLDAIDAAMVTLGVAEDVATEVATEKAVPLATPISGDYASEPPDLRKLSSALKVLDPDCEEKEWKFHRIAPLAYAARKFPEIADALHDLAVRWSSGVLSGDPSQKWVKTGSNGMTGQTAFKYAWMRFTTDNYTGKPASLGTIYFHARGLGWSYPSGQNNGEGGEFA